MKGRAVVVGCRGWRREERQAVAVVGEVVEEAGEVVHGVGLECGGEQEGVERGEWGL